jgi:hypothetical protein
MNKTLGTSAATNKSQLRRAKLWPLGCDHTTSTQSNGSSSPVQGNRANARFFRVYSKDWVGETDRALGATEVVEEDEGVPVVPAPREADIDVPWGGHGQEHRHAPPGLALAQEPRQVLHGRQSPQHEQRGHHPERSPSQPDQPCLLRGEFGVSVDPPRTHQKTSEERRQPHGAAAEIAPHAPTEFGSSRAPALDGGREGDEHGEHGEQQGQEALGQDRNRREAPERPRAARARGSSSPGTPPGRPFERTAPPPGSRGRRCGPRPSPCRPSPAAQSTRTVGKSPAPAPRAGPARGENRRRTQS